MILYCRQPVQNHHVTSRHVYIVFVGDQKFFILGCIPSNSTKYDLTDEVCHAERSMGGKYVLCLPGESI